MKTVQEDDLIFDVSSTINNERFDANALHGTKSTLKRVDFILEYPHEFVFLEIKDPDRPGASNPGQFKQDLIGGALIPELASKYRDTLFFSSLRKVYAKPIIYVVLISMKSLDDALVLTKIDALKNAIPITHRSWSKNSVDSCVILKLDAYKKKYGAESVWRASEYK